MGMTLWVHVLNGRKIEGNQWDHSIMYAHSEELDVLCRQIGVAELSSFFDHTDLEANFSEEEEWNEEAPLDPETGWAYGIDDMRWFEAKTGLEVLERLEEHLRSAPRAARLEVEEGTELLQELRDCISQLAPAAAKNQKFHLAVVM